MSLFPKKKMEFPFKLSFRVNTGHYYKQDYKIINFILNGRMNFFKCSKKIKKKHRNNVSMNILVLHFHIIKGSIKWSFSCI